MVLQGLKIKKKVLWVGIEPTCDRLPFLQGISLRGYQSILIIFSLSDRRDSNPQHLPRKGNTLLSYYRKIISFTHIRI